MTTVPRDDNRVPVPDLMLEIPRGTMSGVSHINKFGRNPDIDTGSLPEDVWDAGGVWVAPTAARIHDIVSTSTDDASAGTGARTVTVEGLDADWKEKTETVTMNGTTDVETVSTYIRIYRMYVVTSGSGADNAGVITATAQTDSTVTAHMATGESQTHMAIYTVPAGKTAYATHGYATINRQGATAGAMAEIAFRFRAAADTATATWRVVWTGGISVNGTSNIQHPFTPYAAFPEKTDLVARITYVSDSNTVISAGFDLILVDN